VGAIRDLLDIKSGISRRDGHELLLERVRLGGRYNSRRLL
jgi:hypothetical protein